MTISAIAFTDHGQTFAERLGFPVDRGIPVHEWTEAHFHTSDALLYIGATGIAVRAIAPYLNSKLTDPAVLVMDEQGQHIIPLLSGHIGGANILAQELAARVGAVPVITTATDLRSLPAIDVWAVQNNCSIENPSAIQSVSSTLLDGGSVGVAITERDIHPPFPATLFLRPRTLILGTGCKKGTDPDLFESEAYAFLRFCQVSPLSLCALATIDIKKDEPALLCFCQKYNLPLRFADAKTLSSLPGTFSQSEFVQKTVGVDNVCERAAVYFGKSLLVGKTAQNGITFALAGDQKL